MSPRINCNLGRSFDRAARYERNDCAVYAIAGAAGITYFDANLWLQKYGRIPREGTEHSTLEKLLLIQFGAEEIELPESRPKIRTILRAHPAGNFVAITGPHGGNHAVGIRDGAMCDNGTARLKYRIVRLWKIKGAPA